MSEMQTQKKPHLTVQIEVFDYRHFNGKDPASPRPSTMVKGVMTCPDGFRTSIEFFLDGHHHFQTPLWNFGLRIGADWKNRLAVQPVAWVPVTKAVQ